VRRVEGEDAKVRRFAAFRYGAKSWKAERQVVARIEASAQGTDARFIVTNVAGAPRWLYEAIYCQRGQAENLIKAHKLHLASDCTSCSKATANQFRLLIHTAAYWLLHTLRGLAPKASFWRAAQFDTLRLALIKVAATRCAETCSLSAAHAAAISLSKRKAVPSSHMRCRTLASLRASATFARFMPRRPASASAQHFRLENRPARVSITLAAS
jgi:hypothetical protein